MEGVTEGVGVAEDWKSVSNEQRYYSCIDFGLTAGKLVAWPWPKATAGATQTAAMAPMTAEIFMVNVE